MRKVIEKSHKLLDFKINEENVGNTLRFNAEFNLIKTQKGYKVVIEIPCKSLREAKTLNDIITSRAKFTFDLFE